MAESHGRKAGAVETTEVVLSPYVETPLNYRTTARVEGAQRYFEKSKVSVVSRDSDRIVLSMPKAYAATRTGIGALIVDRSISERSGGTAAATSAGGMAESAAAWNSGLPDRIDLTMGPGGRIVIPAVFRDAMQVKEGDRIMASVVDGELRLITPMMGVRLAQKLVREMVPEGVSLVDELIAERRREFEREMMDD